MPRLRTQEVVVKVVAALQQMKIPVTAQIAPTTEGVMEADITVGPTEDLTQAAIFVASLGLVMHWDGAAVRVTTRGDWLPEERHPDPLIEADDVIITDAALQVAVSAGLDLAALLAAQIGTGANGRIVKDDVVAYIARLTRPPIPDHPVKP